jgi:LemA protein
MGRLALVGCLGLLILAVLISGVWYVSTRNNFVALDEAVKAQWGQVENDYQRRYDLIPNLVNTVKGYAAHERETLEAVTQARASVGRVTVAPGAPGTTNDITTNPQAFQQYDQAQAGLSNALSRLLVVVEKYPDLKANQNFLDLQSQLEGTENRIAVERRRYNEVAKDYNIAVRRFPASFVASSAGFHEKQYFAVTNPAAREAPKVDFSPQPATATH